MSAGGADIEVYTYHLPGLLLVELFPPPLCTYIVSLNVGNLGSLQDRYLKLFRELNGT